MTPVRYFREKIAQALAGGKAGDVPLGSAVFIILDTELTGLDEKKDTILSVGAVRMRGGSIGLGDTFYRLVNPDAAFAMQSVLIHGITPSDVAGAADIRTVLSEFLRFCCDGILVGHYLSLDLRFLNRALGKYLGSRIKNPVVDTLALYGWILRHCKDRQGLPVSFTDSGLFDIARHFGIDVKNAHNALADAFITAQIFQQFLPILLRKGITGTRGLAEAGNPEKGGDPLGLSYQEIFNL